MNRKWLVVLALFSVNAALAQESGINVTVGARAWQTEWTTFSYFIDPNDPDTNLALTQVSADSEVAFIPLVSVRYRDFIGSVSGLPATEFSFADGGKGEREEFDVNVGYFVMPSVALTLGYKQVSQSGDGARYRPAGPVLGVSASASLGSLWSLYGNLGIGRLKTPSGDDIKFDADYQLTELGFAYTLNTEGVPQRWTFTAGYRIQVLNSKEAFVTAAGVSQDGLDTTQGFTLGVLATF